MMEMGASADSFKIFNELNPTIFEYICYGSTIFSNQICSYRR